MPDGAGRSGADASAMLSEAARIVAGDRNTTHGDKERSFEAIAALWTTYLGMRKVGFASEVRPHDVAQMMSLLKKARVEWGTPVRDHFVDDAGYSAIAGEIALTTVGRAKPEAEAPVGVAWGEASGPDLQQAKPAEAPIAADTRRAQEEVYHGVARAMAEHQAERARSPWTFWYLATPYTASPGGLATAHVLACRCAAALISRGFPVFSPIAHTHHVAMLGGLDARDHALWMVADTPMMKAASGLLVVTAEGWHLSRGIDHEIRQFRAAAKPVVYWNPSGEMPLKSILALQRSPAV